MASNYCSTHSAVVTDRGGGQVIARLENLSEVRWNRLLDDMSYASVTLDAESCKAQKDRLDLIEPRRHELVIFHDENRVWEGPIEEKRQQGGQLTISARDVLAYLHARPLTSYHPGPANGGPPLMGDRIQQILDQELRYPYVAPGIDGAESLIPSWEPNAVYPVHVDPPANIYDHLDIRPGTVPTFTETFPFEMTVYEHLSNLAEGGLDFTTIGRKILIWDSSLEIGRTRTMTTADFDGDVTVYSSGKDLVGVQHVISMREDDPDNPIPPSNTDNVGSALRDISYYGPWAKIHTRTEEGENVSQTVLNEQAMRMSAGRNPVPYEIQVPASARIQLDDRLTVNDLVAGVTVPVIAEIAGRQINSTQRFQSIYISETSAGEEITGTLTASRNEA